MKDNRRNAILEIIQQMPVETQDELQHQLALRGFEVTQATVSRDIRALRLVKRHTQSGRSCYTTSDPSVGGNSRFYAVFSGAVEEIDYASNIVVFKCGAGMANAVCASIDDEKWDDLVGTLAGDDTIFCLMRNETAAKNLAERLNTLR